MSNLSVAGQLQMLEAVGLLALTWRLGRQQAVPLWLRLGGCVVGVAGVAAKAVNGIQNLGLLSGAVSGESAVRQVSWILFFPAILVVCGLSVFGIVQSGRDASLS